MKNIETHSLPTWTIRFDGGGTNVTGPVACGFAVFHHGVLVDLYGSVLPGLITSTNEAEWCGLICAMDHAARQSWSDVEFVGDSQLVVNQVNRRWRVKAENLKRFADRGIKMRTRHDFLVRWEPRASNKDADRACNVALGKVRR